MTVTILIYVVTITAGYTQRIISPQPSELQNLCPGEEVTITCKTRGSALLAWASEEYIGARGTRLEFATFNNIGDIRTSHMNPNTVATLINKTVEDGVQVLVSQLRITAQSQFMNPSVTCTNGRFGTQNTTRLHILVDPGIPQALLAHQIASDSGTCIVYLSWSLPTNIPPDDIAQFIVQIDGIHVANETGNSYMGVYHLCSCGSHIISISAVNRCGRSGSSISITVEDQLSLPQLTMECQDNTSTTVDCGAPLITTNSSVVVVWYNSTVVDSVVEYRCKEGLYPSHVFMATCLENGRWTSNPADHACIPGNPISTVNQATVNLIVAVSSFMVIVLSSVIFFVFGYTCGYKYKQSMTIGQAAGGGHDTEETQPVQLHVQSEVREQDIELNENVAYGPVYDQLYKLTMMSEGDHSDRDSIAHPFNESTKGNIELK